VGSIGWRSKMIRAGYRDDVDDCQTPLMGVSGQARSLQPSELAHASVMGALCAAIAIIAVVLPHAGGRDSKFILTVSDDGPGIAPADRVRVFERFVVWIQTAPALAEGPAWA